MSALTSQQPVVIISIGRSGRPIALHTDALSVASSSQKNSP
jgi:hypothetical protein